MITVEGVSGRPAAAPAIRIESTPHHRTHRQRKTTIETITILLRRFFIRAERKRKIPDEKRTKTAKREKESMPKALPILRIPAAVRG